MSCVETRAYISITSAICGANFDLKKVLSSLLLFVQRQPRDNAYCQRVLFFFVRRTSSLQKNKGHSLFSISQPRIQGYNALYSRFDTTGGHKFVYVPLISTRKPRGEYTVSLASLFSLSFCPSSSVLEIVG